MPVELVIRDGDPWWLSPDIWVVPGDDPAGAIGSPVAGEPAYLWAHVSNNGNLDAANVRVDFYWANPALQVTRSNATFVGSAYSSVPVGSAEDVLCLVPWVPIIVNEGHECLVATANHPGDPLPNPLPDAFDPPTYRQVAQRNLNVLPVSLQASTQLLTISGLRRSDKRVIVTAELGRELESETLSKLGVPELRTATEGRVEVGLQRERRCLTEEDPVGDDKLELRIPRGTSAAVYANVRSRGLRAGEYQVIHIVERMDDDIVGGMAYVVVSDEKEM
jgi:hypothetical protein